LDNLNKSGSTVVSSEKNSEQTPRSNPVCLEVSVTIRSLPGEKADSSPGPSKPTREEAKTVIVFDNGAVLRLASNFPPGQAVILSNPQGRDVVCRVVAPKNLPNVKGYIEVEFLEPTNDFWGIHKSEGQSRSPLPPAPAVEPLPKPTPPTQVVPSAAPPAPPAPPAPARLAPSLPAPVAPLSKAPTFEDIADALPMSPPPTVRAKLPESTPRIPVSRTPDESVHSTLGAARSYSPASTSSPATEMTSFSAAWESNPAPAPARLPSTSTEILGKFSHTTAGSTSGESSSKTGLILGAVAVVLVALGAGYYFTRGGSSATPTPVTLASVTKPAPPNFSAPVSVPTPAAVERPVAEQTPPAEPLPPATAPTPSVPKEIAATAAPAVQPEPHRQTGSVAATQRTQAEVRRPDISADRPQAEVKRPDATTQRPQIDRNLKMSAPNVEGQSGRLVDSSVPNIEDATLSRAVGVPGGGLISTGPHPANPPAPPAAFPTAVSSAKAPTEAKLISSTRPVYPPMAKQTNIEGDVLITAQIDATGKVVGANATAGPVYLRQAAVDAVRNWKYEPATANGKPTSTQISIKIQFRLK
jgi:TonB family protein